MGQIVLLFYILSFFNIFLGFKRVMKLLRNTEGFETISQAVFWEPIYFSPRLANVVVKIECLWFSIRISRQKSFTENFVKNYVALAREFIFALEQCCVDAKKKNIMRENVQSISQIILKSEQGEF